MNNCAHLWSPQCTQSVARLICEVEKMLWFLLVPGNGLMLLLSVKVLIIVYVCIPQIRWIRCFPFQLLLLWCYRENVNLTNGNSSFCWQIDILLSNKNWMPLEWIIKNSLTAWSVHNCSFLSHLHNLMLVYACSFFTSFCIICPIYYFLA